MLSEEEEARIHALPLRVVEKIGLKCLSTETWPILEAAGCAVDRESGVVLFPPEVVEHYLSLAPRRFTLKARNPDNDLKLGGDAIHYRSASSAPNVLARERGRRPGPQADFEALVQLTPALPTCRFPSGHPLAPTDTPANPRHLPSLRSWQTLSDKVTRVYSIGRIRARDSIEMTKIAHGIDDDEMKAAPRLHASINVNSPLVVDAPLIEGAMEMGAAGQGLDVRKQPVDRFGGPRDCSVQSFRRNQDGAAHISRIGHGANVRTQGVRIKIGRASCRERV